MLIRPIGTAPAISVITYLNKKVNEHLVINSYIMCVNGFSIWNLGVLGFDDKKCCSMIQTFWMTFIPPSSGWNEALERRSLFFVELDVEIRMMDEFGSDTIL